MENLYNKGGVVHINKKFEKKLDYLYFREKYKNIKEIKKLVKDCPKFNEDLEIISYINSGSCGIVYEGRIKRKNPKKVALKFILNKGIDQKYDNNQTEQKGKMFTKINKEICLQNKLKHKNITSLYGVYEIHNDCTCIVMEFAKYGDLYHFQSQLIQKNYLSETLLAYITKQILSGLKFCHESKIIHMDIKHQNVLIDEDLNIKLTDLSVSYSYANIKPNTMFSLPLAGTNLFMCPEVLGKNRIYVEDCDKVDMFSLGSLLYNLAYNIFPYGMSLKDKRDFNILREKIMKNSLEIPVNKRYSPLFRNFISGLLDKNIKFRSSIEEALKHPWIQGANLLFLEKEKIFDLEKFLINIITDNIKCFNDYLKEKDREHLYKI